MPPTSKYPLSSQERRILAKFYSRKPELKCLSCGRKGAYKLNGRAGKNHKLSFACTKCPKKVGVAIFCKLVLKISLSPRRSPYAASPSLQISPGQPLSVSPRGQNNPVSDHSPSPPSRVTSAIYPRLLSTTPVPESPVIAHLTSLSSHSTIPETQLPAVEWNSPTDSSLHCSPKANNTVDILAILKRLTLLEHQVLELQRFNHSLEIENQAIKAKNSVLSTQFERITQQISSITIQHPSVTAPALPTAQPVSTTSAPSDLISAPTQAPDTTIQRTRNKGKQVQTYASVVASTSQDNLQQSPSSAIPNTVAGRTFSRIIKQGNTHKSTSKNAAQVIQRNEGTSNEETSDQGAGGRVTYKPPKNLPEAENWRILYFKNVPWTPLSNIRKTFKALNIDLAKVVNLAWRRGKILEIILDRNILQPFTDFVIKNLDWQTTKFSIIPEDTPTADSGLFSKPPVHIAIMSFFAAIKRQAPSQDIAYFLKQQAIQVLESFTDAPFNKLWDAAGPLERVSTQVEDSN